MKISKIVMILFLINRNILRENNNKLIKNNNKQNMNNRKKLLKKN